MTRLALLILFINVWVIISLFWVLVNTILVISANDVFNWWSLISLFIAITVSYTLIKSLDNNK